MKVIDEKGRLFGRINIVDLSVLIFLLLVVGVVGYKLLGGRIQSPSADMKEVSIVMKFKNTEQTAKNLKAGDLLVAGNEFVPVSISSVTYTDAKYPVQTADGELKLATDPIQKDISVTVKTKFPKNHPVVKVANQEVRVGRGFTLKTQLVEMNGVIEDILEQ